MPIYKARRPGTLRVVVWDRNERFERIVSGDRAPAERVEVAMRQQLAENEPCTIRVAKLGNGAPKIIREPVKSGPVVYFVRRGNDGPIKIGKSKDVDSRIETLQCSSAERLILLGTLPGGSFLERILHAAFADSRLEGEWFDATDELLSLLREMFLTDEEREHAARQDQEAREAATGAAE